MPGYGTLPPDQGTGLLPWSWTVEQLTISRSYWLATVSTDGQPHAMPVWGVWMGDALWFSCGLRSRKMRNLRAQPRCSVTTQDPEQPVMLQGTAEVITHRERIAGFLAASNAKYAVNFELDFLDPTVNATVRVVPCIIIGLKESDFSGSPTRWRFS
jgi:PPOX class probable F420-dependent enzyme